VRAVLKSVRASRVKERACVRALLKSVRACLVKERACVYVLHVDVSVELTMIASTDH
jgi:hypothetical protein